MPSRPQLMVLYTNDAVEVRFSDGARLHLLPCGTAFTHNTPQQDVHPVHGMEAVQQRCRYVTSAYRDMLLLALDFRNRFSEQPYLCEELIEAGQVVNLYARIKDIAWPATVNSENTEVLEDGSVCITSADEFASLILSAHRRDFTVCYLSLLSPEKCRERTNARKDRQTAAHCCHSRINEKSERTDKYTNMPDVVPVERHAESRSDNGAKRQSPHCHDISPGGKKSSDCGNMGLEDLNISPITQASCTDSPQAVMSNASGSPITPENTVKDDEAKFRPFSTPTYDLDDTESPVCTPYGKTAVFQEYRQSRGQNSVRFVNAITDNVDGSFIGETFNPVAELNNEKHNIKENQHKLHESNRTLEKCLPAKYYFSAKNKVCESGRTGLYTQENVMVAEGSVGRTVSQSSGEGESQTRCKYCWLTRHISCDECPVNWSQVVKLAREVAEKGIVSFTAEKGPKDSRCVKQTDTSKLRQINRKACVMSRLPLPLPLSCPGQHLHKIQTNHTYDDGKNPLEDPSTFCHGRLKVLLVDGVIYRIVRLPTIKVVEVYPGDGTVIVSQGLSAHFFLHIIPNGEKLEERTYSIKSPPASTKGNYSVKCLMRRAHRFLGYIHQEENRLPASVGLCCWKHEEASIVEPMSTTVLEECEIHGYGKFTALSNGQIRIVFKDRTCLDMTCDFSRRTQSCLEHSSENNLNQAAPRILADKKAGTCRLLLPNGQYQMMDTNYPGVYKRYIDIAREWADWVNSSPMQRQKFYRDKTDENINMSVERELQKIQCFNYIVDNTLLKKNRSASLISAESRSGAFRPYSASEQKARPSILRNSDQNRNKNFEPVNEHCQGTVKINSPPSVYSKSTGSSFQHSATSQNAISNLIGYRSCSSAIPNERLNPIGLSSAMNFHMPVSSKVGQFSGLEGFNSVREALMRTSNVIKDIDHILEKR